MKLFTCDVSLGRTSLVPWMISSSWRFRDKVEFSKIFKFRVYSPDLAYIQSGFFQARTKCQLFLANFGFNCSPIFHLWKWCPLKTSYKLLKKKSQSPTLNFCWCTRWAWWNFCLISPSTGSETVHICWVQEVKLYILAEHRKWNCTYLLSKGSETVHICWVQEVKLYIFAE